jgi:hypothetical protein
MRRPDSSEWLLLAALVVLFVASIWIIGNTFVTREAPELVGRTPTPTTPVIYPIPIATPVVLTCSYTQETRRWFR